MTSGVAMILIAGRPSFERLCTERLLEAGRSVRCVADTGEAERVCAENGGASVLVIDSTVLEAPRDPQWRELRSRHPELAAVVCCPLSRNEIQRTDRNTLLVNPINGLGIRDALDLLDSYHLEADRSTWAKHFSGFRAPISPVFKRVS